MSEKVPDLMAALEEEQSMVDEQRLYGLPHAEVMYFDPETAYESEIEPNVDEYDRRPWEIEEWSVHPPIYHVPAAAPIIDRIIEWIADDGELDEYAFNHFVGARKEPDVVAAAEALREVLASKVAYCMADKCLRTLTVTWDDAGEPLLDGEPMYVKGRRGSL